MKNRKKIAIVLIVAGVLMMLLGVCAVLFTSSKVKNDSVVELYVYPNTSFEQLEGELKQKGVIDVGIPYSNFVKLLSDMQNVRSGYYKVAPNMTQLDLAKMFVRGLQTPIKLVVGKSRTHEEFAKKISSQLMMEERDLQIAIENRESDKDLFECVVPDTYEVYWNVSAEKLLQRLESESAKWWESQSKRLETIGLNPHQVVVLASIVEEETNKNDEKPIIAGVYINRLNKDMLLQADPTVKYAVGDFSIKRVMYKHLQTDSPYNTYMYKGLPPSPICLPEKSSLMSILNYQKHDYIFFCAKEDFSGYHNFAATPAEHYANANRYQAALNKLGIR